MAKISELARKIKELSERLVEGVKANGSTTEDKGISEQSKNSYLR